MLDDDYSNYSTTTTPKQVGWLPSSTIADVVKMIIDGDIMPNFSIDSRTLNSSLPSETALKLMKINNIFSLSTKLIHVVGFYGRIQFFEGLLQAEADPYITDDQSRTIVHYAAANGKLNFLKYANDMNFNITAIDSKMRTFVHYAAAFNFPEIITWAAQRNINLNHVSEEGSPLHIACFYRNFRVVEALCKAKVNPGIIIKGKTPLIMCLNRYFFEAIPLLLNMGMDINQHIQSGWTTLHHSIRIKSLLFSRVLIQFGADVNAKDPFGWTPLLLAAQSLQVETVKLLLEKGARVDVMTSCGSTLLQLVNNCYDCAEKREILELLSDYNVSKNYEHSPSEECGRL